MQKRALLGLAKTVAILILVMSLVAVAYGLFVLGADLFVEYDEWDGIGVAIGVVILVVSVPITVTSVVWLRLLRHRG